MTDLPAGPGARTDGADRGDDGAPPAPPASPPPPDAFPLRRTPPRRRPGNALAFLLLGVLPAAALPLLWFVATGALAADVAAGLVGAGVCAAVAWLLWLYALPRPPPVRIDDERLRVPFHRSLVSVHLDEIVSLRTVGHEVQLIAAVPAGQRPRGDVGVWTLPVRCFVDGAAGAARFVDGVRLRLAGRPQGPALLARLDDNALRQDRFAQRRPWVTWLCVGACVGVFAGEWITGAPGSAARLLRWGANSGVRVADGEVWRVVTACFLHGNLLHLAMNALSLSPLGTLLERWMGRPAIAVTLFVAGAGGHVASALVGRTPLSVGASGAVFGLLGVLLVSTVRFRGAGSGGPRVPWTSWAYLLLANGLLSLLPFVDVVAHAGGFVGGLVCGLLLSPRPGAPPVLAAARQRVLAAVVAVLTLAAVAFAVAAAVAPGRPVTAPAVTEATTRATTLPRTKATAGA
jgi:rhomboid protease GluP